MIGVLNAVMLYLGYLTLSLFDPWGYMPDIVQVVFFALLFLAMMFLILRGMTGQQRVLSRVTLRLSLLSLMAVVIAGLWAGPDALRRLEIAVKPRGLFSYPVPEVTILVTPPTYSGQEKFTEKLLSSQQLSETSLGNPAAIPEGSQIKVTVAHAGYPPTLVVEDQEYPFLLMEKGGYVAEFTARQQMTWQIREGSRQIGQWPLILLEDEAPIIDRVEFRRMQGGDGLFALSLGLQDDYAIAKVTVGVGVSGDVTSSQHEAILPISALKKFAGDVYLDLTSSDFAGKMTPLVITVEDEAGQVQQRVIENVTLPRRIFSDPLARQIMEIRQNIQQYPDERVKYARQLMAMGLVPDNGPPEIKTPAIFYMTLRSAYWRLTKPLNEQDIGTARQMLWDLALLMEAGETGQFKKDILDLLASLKLAIYQKQDLSEIRRQLQQIDREIVLHLREPSLKSEKPYIDVNSLRKIYSKILLYTHNQKENEVISLISYLEHGFILQDRDMLSGQGFLRFQTAQQARNRLADFETIQRQIIAAALRHSVKLELASADTSADLPLPQIQNMDQWIESQTKIAEDVADMGRELMKSGIDASGITVAISDLSRDSARSMQEKDLEMARQYQSQIMTMIHSLKRLLDQEMRYDPMIDPSL